MYKSTRVRAGDGLEGHLSVSVHQGKGWRDGSSVRVLTVLTKTPGSIPSTHIRCFTTSPIPGALTHFAGVQARALT